MMTTRLIARFALLLTLLFAVISVGSRILAQVTGTHEIMLMLRWSSLARLEAVLVDLSTGEVTPTVFPFPDLYRCSEIDLSPDHRWFVGACETQSDITQPDVFAVPVGGDYAQVIRLTDDFGSEYALSWDTDSQHLRYAVYPIWHVEQITVDRDTITQVRRIIPTRSIDWKWSPNRARFVSMITLPNYNALILQLFRADGTFEREVITRYNWEKVVGWMPDSRRLVMLNRDYGNPIAQMILMDMDSGRSQLVTELPNSLNLRCWAVSSRGAVLCGESVNGYLETLSVFDPDTHTRRDLQLSIPLHQSSFWFSYP